MSRYVYRVAPHNSLAVFALEERAELVAKLSSASTWGEFARLDPESYERMCEDMEDYEEVPPRADEPFDISMAPGFDDGDYPPWLQPEMDLCVPRDLLEMYGRRGSTMLNGAFWEISPENMEVLASELRRRGHTARHAPELEFH